MQKGIIEKVFFLHLFEKSENNYELKYLIKNNKG